MEGTSKYRARLTDPVQTEDVFVGLYGKNLDLRSDPLRRYRWYYLDGPAGPGRTFLLDCQGGEGRDTSVGCTGIGVRSFYHRGVPLQAALLADFVVDRAHRTGLPAMTLQRAVRSYVLQHFGLAYGFPNSLAIKVFQRIGAPQLGKMARFVRVLHHGPYLERYLRSPILCYLGGKLCDRAVDLIHRLRLRRTASVHLMWLGGASEVDGRFDALFQEVRGAYPLIGDRGAAFLRWRFFAKPGDRSDVATLLDGARRLRAYAVIQPEGRIAHVRDVLGASDAAIGALLSRLVLPLRKRGFDTLSLRFLGTRRFSDLLAAQGFVIRDQDRAVIAEAGAFYPGDPATFADVENWYLTDADEDT